MFIKKYGVQMILKYVNYRLLQDCSAGRGVCYRSYDADKNYWRKCQIYLNQVYSRELC